MTANGTILVVDDDTAHRTMLRTLVGGWGYEISEADDGGTATDRVRQQAYDLVLMDVRMLKVSGIEALAAIKKLNPAIPVIIMTAYSSVETAVDALKQGAHDYLTKPLDFDKLRVTIERAMEHTRLREENRRLRESLGLRFDRSRIIGQSPAMVKLLDTVSQVAPSEATVLITGESGTGKELIAAAIHFNSSRRDGPFVQLNCAAITETLLESELFGHEKGAFTGAERRREGRFHQADGGSLFLDEVGNLSRSAQEKLLRVIEYKNDNSKQGTVKVVYDHRRIMNLDRNVTELQTKLGSAGWVPTGEVFVKADVTPSGCIILVLVSEKEQSSAAQSKYALEGCKSGASLDSILFSQHSFRYPFGSSGVRGIYNVAAPRRG